MEVFGLDLGVRQNPNEDTFSMKTPNSPFLLSRRIIPGKSTERDGVGGLPGSGVQMIQRDVVEHLPIHQDIEDRITALLVDQRPRLEWLVEAFFDHLHDPFAGTAGAGRCIPGAPASRAQPPSPLYPSATWAATDWPAA